MTAPAATKGTFADFKIVKTRKLAQLVIEIPIEQADEALAALGGLPRSDSERWVAVARLHQPSEPFMPIGSDDAIRHAFCDLPFPTQAGIKSNDLTFQLWMSHYHSYYTKTRQLTDGEWEDIQLSFPDCASAIRHYCGVESRADILIGTEAGHKWIELLRAFEERYHLRSGNEKD